MTIDIRMLLVWGLLIYLQNMFELWDSIFRRELSGSVGEVPGQLQSGVLKVGYLMVNQNRDDLNDPANSQWSSNLNQEEFGQVNRKQLWSLLTLFTFLVLPAEIH